MRWSEENWTAWKARQTTPPGNDTSPPPGCPGVRGPYILPMPPTVNHSSGPTANGGRYLTKEHLAFRAEVERIVGGMKEGPPLAGRLRVDITLIPKDRRRFDLDNRIKGLLDALQRAGVMADDGQVDKLAIQRETPRPETAGFAIVKVEEL